MSNLINVKKVVGKSKKTGREYTAYELRIGQYTQRFFPTPIEILYIDQILKKQAIEDFKKGNEGDGDLDVDSDK